MHVTRERCRQRPAHGELAQIVVEDNLCEFEGETTRVKPTVVDGSIGKHGHEYTLEGSLQAMEPRAGSHCPIRMHSLEGSIQHSACTWYTVTARNEQAPPQCEACSAVATYELWQEAA